MRKFPVKHVEDNLVFNKKGEIWAYYKIVGFSYDFLDFDEKKRPFLHQFSYLSNAGLDLHFLSVPHPTDVEGIIDATIEEMKLKNYTLKESGISFMEQTKKSLMKNNEENETSEYYDYVGVQLDLSKNKYISSNPMIELAQKTRSFLEKVDLPTYRSTVLNPETDILLNVIKSFKSQAKIIESSLNDAFGNVQKAKEYEIYNIIEKSYSVRNNNSDVKNRRNFKVGKRVTGVDDKGKEHEAIRTMPEEFLELQNTNVDEFFHPKMLRLSKVNDENEVETLYTQHFVISHMVDVNWHPGFEWIHYLKLQLGFPVTVSVRIDNMPNEMIKKRLSNVKLEVQDQQVEATKGGEQTDLAVSEAKGGIVRMEKYFQETGYPAHVCSFIIKITAKDEAQLKIRGEELKSNLSKRGIRIVAPYGEQLNLMYETLPGSNKIIEDYKMEVDSGLLAGMMFGTSTNIGDNRGFYIGDTSVFSKPVFIQPDLAAKAFEGLGNVVESISALVAGMVGKGKSFFMNLFIYLSALTGSRGLIIDPKGDRKDWDKGLPYIAREEIEVWTLGSDKNDAGSLDPFRTSSSIDEGIELSLDILAYLTNVKVEDLGYNLLNQAIVNVSKTEDPCIGAVIEILDNMYENRPPKMSDEIFNALEKIVSTLESLKMQRLSSLLFGEVGQKGKILDHNKTIQVLMIQNLNLPSEKVKRDELVPTHKISEAIMISITAWTKQYMINSERSIHKFILQDEASAIERNPKGSELMDHIVRQGRYFNTTLLKGSQNASDHGRDVANMGMKFSFGLRDTEEAVEMLNYLNLPVTEENIFKLKNLDRGECVFQDIYGRTAEIRINPVFVDLHNAFDSSTSTEEERERERNRM